MADWIDEVVSVFVDSLDKHTKSNRGIQKGDILGVDRGLYEHYAVYVDDDHVIHYTGGGDDFEGDIAIRETSFRDFLGGETSYFVCEFPESHTPPHKRQQFTSSVMQDIRWLIVHTVALASGTIICSQITASTLQFGVKRISLNHGRLRNCSEEMIFCGYVCHKIVKFNKNDDILYIWR